MLFSQIVTTCLNFRQTDYQDKRNLCGGLVLTDFKMSIDTPCEVLGLKDNYIDILMFLAVIKVCLFDGHAIEKRKISFVSRIISV